MLVVDVFDDAALFQFGRRAAAVPARGFPSKPLLIDQHRETFFEAELAGCRRFPVAHGRHRPCRAVS